MNSIMNSIILIINRAILNHWFNSSTIRNHFNSSTLRNHCETSLDPSGPVASLQVLPVPSLFASRRAHGRLHPGMLPRICCQAPGGGRGLQGIQHWPGESQRSEQWENGGVVHVSDKIIVNPGETTTPCSGLSRWLMVDLLVNQCILMAWQ